MFLKKTDFIFKKINENAPIFATFPHIHPPSPPSPLRCPLRPLATPRGAPPPEEGQEAGGRVQPEEKARKADSTFKKNESPPAPLPHPAALPPERHGGEASEGVAIGAL